MEQENLKVTTSEIRYSIHQAHSGICNICLCAYTMVCPQYMPLWTVGVCPRSSLSNYPIFYKTFNGPKHSTLNFYTLFYAILFPLVKYHTIIS